MGSDVKALDVGYTITDSVDAQGRPQKKYTLPTVDFMEAFDLANAITASRGANPFWRITEARNGTAARMEHAIKVMDDFAAGVIAQKRKSGVKPGKEGDMLDLFMSMKGDGDEELTDAELRDHVLNFIIAGRDTTAQTLSWAVYEVSQHPEIERKLRAEILSIVGKDREIVYDDLKELKYTNAVFNETLRLHANVPAQARRVTADCVLPGTGTKVYKDQLVQVSSWAMGHLERIWGPDAKEFRPERWIDEKGSLVKVNNFQWPVFNAGVYKAAESVRARSDFVASCGIGLRLGRAKTLLFPEIRSATLLGVKQ